MGQGTRKQGGRGCPRGVNGSIIRLAGDFPLASKKQLPRATLEASGEVLDPV